MDAKFQLWVQKAGWNQASADYDSSWRSQLQPATDKLLAFAGVQPGESVIEAASGTGVITLAVAKQSKTGRVLATDLSAKMLALLDKAAAEAGLTNIETAKRSAESLDSNELFDVALCALGLMYVPNPLAALSELHRTLRPGGRITVSVWGERSNCAWASLFSIVDARVKSEVCPMFFGMGAPTALTGALSRQGFEDIQEERLSITLDFKNEEAALDAAFVGGPVALAYARFDESTRTSARAEYLDSIAQYRYGESYRLPGEFVIASARKPE